MISTKERLKNILQSVQNCNKTSTDDDLASEGDFFQEPGKKEERSSKSACTVRVFLAFVKFFLYPLVYGSYARKTAKKQPHMLFASREVRIRKNCARGLEYRPRTRAEGRTQDRGNKLFIGLK